MCFVEYHKSPKPDSILLSLEILEMENRSHDKAYKYIQLSSDHTS